VNHGTFPNIAVVELRLLIFVRDAVKLSIEDSPTIVSLFLLLANMIQTIEAEVKAEEEELIWSVPAYDDLKEAPKEVAISTVSPAFETTALVAFDAKATSVVAWKIKVASCDDK